MEWLQRHGGFTAATAGTMLRRDPTWLLAGSEADLRGALQRLRGLGATDRRVATAACAQPRLLSLSEDAMQQAVRCGDRLSA